MIGDKPTVYAVKVWAYREHVDQTVDFWGVSTKGFKDAEQRAWERMNNFDSGATKHFDNGVSEQVVLKEGE